MVAIASPIFTVFNNGQVVSGAKVYTYITDTTTLLDTYSDAALTTKNSNPIIADANGQVTIFVSTASNLKLGLYTSSGAFIREIDPVYPAAVASGGGGSGEASIVAADTTDIGSTGLNLVNVTGNTTINSLGTSALLSTPLYTVRFTGAPLLTNSGNIILPGGKDIQAAAGDAAVFEYLGSGVWQCLNYQKASGKAVISTSPVQSSFKNFSAAWASNTTLTVSADEVIVEDASGNTAKASNVAVTIDTAVTGANGCDVAFSGFSSNSWAYAYIIAKSDGTKAGLLSASATAPTLPAGYTLKTGYMTPVRLDSGKNIVGFKQSGRRWQYLVGSNLGNLPIMSSGVNGNPATPTFSAVALGSFVPPNAASILGAAYSGPAGGTDAMCVAPNNNYGAQTSTSNPPPVGFNAATSSNGSATIPFEFILESTNLYWATTSGNAVLTCTGFTVNI